MAQKNFPPPDEDMFALWRAVFALVHADGTFSDAEKAYIEKIIEIFSFTPKQKKIVKDDLKNKADVTELFSKINETNYKRQFFIMARTIVWCDGFLHELELKAVNQIVKKLGKQKTLYQNELRWIDRKPLIEEGEIPSQPQDDVMQIVQAHMSNFYKENRR